MVIDSEKIRTIRVNTALSMLLALVSPHSSEQISMVSAVFLYGLQKSQLSFDSDTESVDQISECFHDLRSYLSSRFVETDDSYTIIRSCLSDEIRRLNIQYETNNAGVVFSLFTSWTYGEGLRYSHPVSDLDNLFWDAFWLLCASRPHLFSALSELRTVRPEPDPSDEALHTFLYRLSYLTDRDGFLCELYAMLRSDIRLKEIGLFVLHQLAELQDQYNHLFDYRTEGSLPSGYDAHYALERINLFPDEISHPLIGIYIRYLRAEACRFIDAFENAILQYNALLQNLNHLETNDLYRDRMDIRWMRICLHHAIGRCLQKADIPEHMMLAGKEFEAMLPLVRDQDRSKPFLSICLKNYATCLENLYEYGSAIKQYEKVIEMQTVAHRNYKLYDTYCSAVMKNWDQLYEKISENWMKNIRNLSLPADCYPISETLIEKMDIYLKVAERLKTELPNINIQRAKLYIYRMLAGLDDPAFCLEEARREISIADCLSVEKTGIYYIRRDLNYAEYLITGDITRLRRASDINIRLKGRGDSPAFAALLKRLE